MSRPCPIRRDSEKRLWRLVTLSPLLFLLLAGCVSPPSELQVEPEVAGRFYEDTSLTSLQARVEEAVSAEIRRQGIPALQLAIYGERERIELAFGTEGPRRQQPVGVDRSFRLGGITKLYTAVVILSLVEEGRLTLEQTVEGWFPELPGAQEITVASLLRERSGLQSYTGREFGSLRLILQPRREWERQELLRRISGAGVEEEANSAGGGSNNSDYLLLGLVAEGVTGERFPDLLEREIYAPLGLQRTGLAVGLPLPHLLTGYDYDLLPFGNHRIEPTNRAIGSWAYTAGGLVSTAGEMARFFSALHEGRLVSGRMVERMETEAYGLREVEIEAERLHGRAGTIPGFGSLLFWWPDEATTIAITANRSEIDHEALLRTVVRELSR